MLNKLRKCRTFKKFHPQNVCFKKPVLHIKVSVPNFKVLGHVPSSGDFEKWLPIYYL